MSHGCSALYRCRKWAPGSFWIRLRSRVLIPPCEVQVEEGVTPIVRDAGRQYLALEGSVDPAVLGFLPFAIDHLHARRALLDAGTIQQLLRPRRPLCSD